MCGTGFDMNILTQLLYVLDGGHLIGTTRCFVALLLSFATRSTENQKLIASDPSFRSALSNVLSSSTALDVLLEMFEISCVPASPLLSFKLTQLMLALAGLIA
jgi:hypothetical protein